MFSSCQRPSSDDDRPRRKHRDRSRAEKRYAFGFKINADALEKNMRQRDGENEGYKNSDVLEH